MLPTITWDNIINDVPYRESDKDLISKYVYIGENLLICSINIQMLSDRLSEEQVDILYAILFNICRYPFAKMFYVYRESAIDSQTIKIDDILKEYDNVIKQINNFKIILYNVKNNIKNNIITDDPFSMFFNELAIPLQQSYYIKEVKDYGGYKPEGRDLSKFDFFEIFAGNDPAGMLDILDTELRINDQSSQELLYLFRNIVEKISALRMCFMTRLHIKSICIFNCIRIMDKYLMTIIQDIYNVINDKSDIISKKHKCEQIMEKLIDTFIVIKSSAKNNGANGDKFDISNIIGKKHHLVGFEDVFSDTLYAITTVNSRELIKYMSQQFNITDSDIYTYQLSIFEIMSSSKSSRKSNNSANYTFMSRNIPMAATSAVVSKKSTSPGGTRRSKSPGATARPKSPGGTRRSKSPGATARPKSPGATINYGNLKSNFNTTKNNEYTSQKRLTSQEANDINIYRDNIKRLKKQYPNINIDDIIDSTIGNKDLKTTDQIINYVEEQSILMDKTNRQTANSLYKSDFASKKQKSPDAFNMSNMMQSIPVLLEYNIHYINSDDIFPLKSISENLNTQETRIVNFYLNIGKDIFDRYLADILSFTNTELETYHDYIQVLFPTEQFSNATGIDFDLVTPKVSKLFSEMSDRGISLRTHVIKSLKKMLDFYGFFLYTRTPDINTWVIEFNKKSRYIVNGSHNLLRISRIIRSLSLLGLRQLSKLFYESLCDNYPEINEKSKKFFYDGTIANPFGIL